MGKFVWGGIAVLLLLTGCQGKTQTESQMLESFNAYIQDGNLTFQAVFPDRETHNGTFRFSVHDGEEVIHREETTVSTRDFTELAKCTEEFCGTYQAYIHSQPTTLNETYDARVIFNGAKDYTASDKLEVLG